MTNTVQTRPWAEIVDFYEHLASENGPPLEAMIELVRFLASSQYANGMFAYASHAVLCIGRTPNFIARSGELQIAFNETEQNFTFTYIQRPDENFPWSRSCAQSEWKPAFERLMHQRLRWFHQG